MMCPAIDSLRLGGVDGQAAGRGEPRHLPAAAMQAAMTRSRPLAPTLGALRHHSRR
jgi:hypothetical protein